MKKVTVGTHFNKATLWLGILISFNQQTVCLSVENCYEWVVVAEKWKMRFINYDTSWADVIFYWD